MNTVEEVKGKLDIVDIVSGYISLNQAGGNFRACCPFHNEKTPSFMVSREKQIWHCFGCDKGGDVLSFVQEYEGVDFKEALRLLAQKANVTLSGFNFKPKQDNSRLYEINKLAADFYHNLLMQDSQVAKKVLKYIDNRKINKGSFDNWSLGLSGESWDGLLKYLVSKGFKEVDIFQAGLILKKKDGSGHIDRFRKRLMFPICDTQGQVVAFTSRTLSGIAYDEIEQGGKYVNSPQTAIYDKSRILYGWHLAKDTIRQKKYLIIVEGNMDAIAASQTSSKNVVAVSGTALTAEHIKLIKRYANNIILAFDGDAAGSRAAFRSVVLGWQNDMNIKILLLSKGKDPADIVKEDSKKWLQLIKDSVPVMDYYLKRIIAGVDLSRADHKKIAISKLLPIIKFLKSQVEQAHYLKLISDRLQTPIQILQQDLGKTKSFIEAQQTPTVTRQAAKKKISFSLAEELLALAFYKGVYLEKLIDEIEPDMVSVEVESLYRKLIIYYTKHQNLDNFIDYPELDNTEKELWVKLSILGEKNYQGLPDGELVDSFDNMLSNIKLHHLEGQRQGLINDMKQAELSGIEDKVEQLQQEIQLLGNEIEKLKK
jgi:DNA primase